MIRSKIIYESRIFKTFTVTLITEHMYMGNESVKGSDLIVRYIFTNNFILPFDAKYYFILSTIPVKHTDERTKSTYILTFKIYYAFMLVLSLKSFCSTSCWDLKGRYFNYEKNTIFEGRIIYSPLSTPPI